MKRKLLLLSAFAFAALILIRPEILTSNKVFPVANVCNAPPVDTTCSQPSCHPRPYLASNPDTLTLLIDTSASFVNNTTLNDSFQYVGGTTYYIKFQINSTTGVYGFQMVPQDVNNVMAGSFALINTENTHINTTPPTGTHQYISHLNADSNKLWTFKWTAPSATTGQITFYYAYNTSTLEFLDSLPPHTSPPPSGVPGGQIYLGTAVITPSTAAINELPASVSMLNMFPNPTNGNFGLLFDLKKSEVVSVNVYSIAGSLSKLLLDNSRVNAGSYNQSFDLSNLAPGIYLVKIQIGNATITRKLIKL